MTEKNNQILERLAKQKADATQEESNRKKRAIEAEQLRKKLCELVKQAGVDQIEIWNYNWHYGCAYLRVVKATGPAWLYSYSSYVHPFDQPDPYGDIFNFPAHLLENSDVLGALKYIVGALEKGTAYILKG